MEPGVLLMLTRDGAPFEAAARYGVKTAQLQCWDIPALTPELARKVRTGMERHDIRLAAYWAGYSGRIVWNSADGPATCGLVPADLRSRRVEELKRGADFAREIGAPAIITHAGFIPENPRCRDYAETLNALYDVALHCLNLGLGFWFESGQETPLTLLRTIEDLALPNLGVNLDTANLILYGRGNPVDALEVVGKYVRNLHIKDGLFPTGGYTLGTEVALGQGRADFDRIVRKLYELDFTGELILEREISGDQQERDIIAGLELLRSLIDKYRK